MKNTLSNEYIYRIATAFLKHATPIKTYERILRQLKELTGALDGNMYLFKRGRFEQVYSTCPKGSLVTPRVKGATYKSYIERRILIKNDTFMDKYHPEVSLHAPFVVMIPLSNGGRPFGAINLHFSGKPSPITEKKYALQLYGSLAALAIYKAQLYSSASQALEYRDLFISVAAHEIKNPLTVISAYNKMIQEELIKGGTPDVAWTREIDKHIKGTTRLMNELLQVKAIKKRRFTLRKTKGNLHEIVQRAIAYTHSRYPAITIEFIAKIPQGQTDIISDKHKLVQVVANILTNAAKFSQPAQVIKIVLIKTHKTYTISVIDKGAGIAKEELPRIFDKYYRGALKRRQGMGVGLYLSKHIVEAHGGTISVQSQVGMGTEFIIQLPIN